MAPNLKSAPRGVHEDLRAAVRCGSKIDTNGFLRLVDHWQSTAHLSLLETYQDDVFSKLVAVKAANLIVRRFELQHRRRVLLSRPSHLIVDPTNACQLACPGCVHGENWDPSLWPKKTLEGDRFTQFLSHFGTTGCSTMLYNFGEPLLNRKFPDFVRLTKGYQPFAAASTNLSMPIDAEAIVGSGLDLLHLSIDGTTQETYERYRIGGRLELILDNVRALVSARRRVQSDRPYLAWQFLTFEHNQHQVEDAIDMAKNLGVDSVKVYTPSDWGWSDRTIRPVRSPLQGEHRFRPFAQNIDLSMWRASMLTEDVAENVHTAFQTSWAEKFRRNGIEEADCDKSSTCTWLYDNITLDGAGRLMPCCMPPLPGRQMVFAQFAPKDEATDFDYVNTKMAILSRTAFADSAAYAAQVEELPEAQKPYCASCQAKPKMPFAWPFAQKRVTAMDPKQVLARLHFEELTAV